MSRLQFIFDIQQNREIMTAQKLSPTLQTVEEFINFYNGASKRELKAILKNLKNPTSRIRKNERDAIIALLA